MFIKETGQISDQDYLFKTLYLNSKEFELHHDNLNLLAEDQKVDFIVLLQNKTVNFEHYTNEDSAKIIEVEQLKSPDHIGDLGKGIYAIPSKQHDLFVEGYDNLCTFFEDYHEEQICRISGEFSGVFGLCVYGYQHEGYLVLKKGNVDIYNIETLPLEDFLWGI